MSIDTDERFAAELSGQLRRIATGLTPDHDIETAVGVRAAARARRRTIARATAGVGVVLLVVAGVAWVGARPTSPSEPANPSGFSAPDVVYPVIDDALLPADLRGQLRPDISTTDPGQWVGILAPADDPNVDAFVLVSVAPTNDMIPLTGDTPSRSDVFEEPSDRGTTLSLRRDGFDIRLITFDVRFAYTLIDRLAVTDTGFELIDDGGPTDTVWVTPPYEPTANTGALFSRRNGDLEIVIHPLPASFLAFIGTCNDGTDRLTLCELGDGANAAASIQLDATHTLVVSSNRLSTEELSRIAAGVRFVTFEQWNADGLPAPTTVAPNPAAVWPLLDEAAVPDRLVSGIEAALVSRPFPTITGVVGTLDADGNPLSLTLVFIHPPFGERAPGESPFGYVPGRREGVTEGTADGVTVLSTWVGDWELNVIGSDVDQSYAVLEAVDLVKDEHGVVNSYILSELPNGLQELSVTTFLPVGTSPMIGIGDTYPAKVTMLPLPLAAAIAGTGGSSLTATVVDGRRAYSWTHPDGRHSIAVAVTSTDTMVVTGDATITEEELQAIADGITFGTQAEWEARYGVSVREIEQEMSTTTEPG